MHQFPIHVVCKWLGNSSKIAQKLYALTTDKDFDRAVATETKTTRAEPILVQKQRGLEDSPNGAESVSDLENTRENDGFPNHVTVPSAEGTGLEQPTHSPGNSIVECNFGTKTTRASALPNFDATTDPRFGELVELWNLSSDEERDSILDAVRQACLRVTEGGAL